MPNHPLFYPVSEHLPATPLHDQIQIALAIADPQVLKSLLTNCLPAIAQPQEIGEVSAEIGIPLQDQQTADAVVHFEAVKCVLADSPPVTPSEEAQSCHSPYRHQTKTSQSKHSKCESETLTLAHNVSLAQAIALLTKVGFGPQQAQEILHLSYEASHKSWWYALDATGQFSIPFLRYIRTLRYPDGTVSLQYKDYFSETKPVGFQSLPQKVLVIVREDSQSFSQTLRQINADRTALGITQAILICNTIAELEAQAFITQGISLYPATELILPTQANCGICATHTCPMNGTADSAIAVCYRFCLEGSYV
ncbi:MULTISPECIES: hypothetical protein [Trichocoleus]|uniref:Uncharacterized protein n=1 Tax=Trichocoleus desertorum GB2-A4 TaxID=2933944 RepID=A0ABV0JAB3_9CYAN|nr:hypothetical protein [Trichocoleus sp. FACHB-46]MBD1861419.1 hypothetical protein [Trichocoleus sp. FACHB-46]